MDPRKDHARSPAGAVAAILARGGDRFPGRPPGAPFPLQAGGMVPAVLRLPWAPAEAWIADLVERPLRPLAFQGHEIPVPLVPGGVVTVLVRD